MIWHQLQGHDPQVEMFRRAISRQRLAHAYLLVGPSGIGKRMFARLLAQCLFCHQRRDEELDACGVCSPCKQMQAGTHPDLIEIGLPDGKKELPIELMVGDRESRGRAGLCHEIAMTPMSASRRIAIIDDADTMNEASANSLLKTLEEPPAGSMLFLLTPDTEPILPTIRSRCQPVQFSPLSDEQVRRLLAQEAEGEITIPDDVLTMAEGSLGLARQLCEPGLNKLWKAVQKHMMSSNLNSVAAVRAVSDALDELGGDTATQRQNMRWVLRFTVEALRQRLATADSVEESDRLGLMLERCFDGELHLRQTMPIPLCLESLFTEVGRRSRMISS